MTARNWSKDRQRELTQLARAQDRSDAVGVSIEEGKRRARVRDQQSVWMTIRCYSCGHARDLVVNLGAVRRPLKLRCSACGDLQKL